MMKATIEILLDEETVLGSSTIGRYMVRYYDDDDEEVGGSFHKTIEEAEVEVRDSRHGLRDIVDNHGPTPHHAACSQVGFELQGSRGCALGDDGHTAKGSHVAFP